MKILIYSFLLIVSPYSFANCNSVDALVKQMMQKNQVNGVAIAMIGHDKTEFCNYGYADTNTKSKVNEHTIFDIASISKTFTAMLAAIAAADGKLDLEKPISDYVPALQDNLAYNKVNSQELLAHVSGLNFSGETNFKQFNQAKFIINLNKTESQYLPETHYRYGQVGISLVAIALENIYRQSFKDILQQQLLNRLNMNETFIDVPKTYENIAIGYDKNNQPLPPFNIGLLTPAGGLKSSSSDLAKYIQMQLTDNQKSPFSKALNLVHKNYYCLYPDGTYQQLGWVYHPRGDLLSQFRADPAKSVNFKPQELAKECLIASDGFIEKSGNSRGMSLYVIYLPGTANGVVVLTNKAQVADSVNLGRSILRQLNANS